ncbi:Pre-mRNA-splicing factor SYF1, variant 2 [Balamuthia mandrillaris]
MKIKDAKSWLECLDEADFPHEEDVLRNPYSLKSWIRYLDFKSDAPPHVKNVLYERAVRELPGSYKLWHRYLSERRAQVKGTPPFGPHMEAVNTAFERALVYMHKMPRIWVDYCTLLTQQPGKVTHTRRTFDRALRALPVTQHDRIWPLYVEWVRKVAIPETTLRVYRRYLKTFPEVAEDYIEYLLSVGYINEAVHKLAEIVNDTHFHSQKGQSKHQLWLKLCELISKYPKQITGLKSEAILREGIRHFTDEVGQLWVALAEYYIRLANFEKARDVFEEGINTVMTVRDFSQIWDAYTRFEDGMIESQMEMQAEAEGEESDIDFDLRIARYENLINQRPLLLSSVVLRQNPHNVHEWHKRAKIFHDNPVERAKVYAEAVRTVDTKKATGKPHSLWVSYAKLYEKGGDLDSARQIFAKAAQVEYRSVDDLASIWCEYAEMELRNQNYKEALKVLEKATVVPRITKVSGDQPVQKRLFKSTKLWSFYADVEESLGTFMSTKAIYDRMIELRITTPQIILNYATFLEENNYFEESFKAYEKGVSLFEFPYVMDLWVAYLTKFVARYGGKKLERIRDLFEQALEGVPPKEAKTLYLMYAHVEEQYGLARHAMSVYDRACRAVVDDDKPFVRLPSLLFLSSSFLSFSSSFLFFVVSCLLACLFADSHPLSGDFLTAVHDLSIASDRIFRCHKDERDLRPGHRLPAGQVRQGHVP